MRISRYDDDDDDIYELRTELHRSSVEPCSTSDLGDSGGPGAGASLSELKLRPGSWE